MKLKIISNLGYQKQKSKLLRVNYLNLNPFMGKRIYFKKKITCKN